MERPINDEELSLMVTTIHTHCYRLCVPKFVMVYVLRMMHEIQRLRSVYHANSIEGMGDSVQQSEAEEQEAEEEAVPV